MQYNKIIINEKKFGLSYSSIYLINIYLNKGGNLNKYLFK